MYYYLLYNSSFSFIVENRLFTTILYGSILYIVTHAIVNNCNIEALGIVNNYYWTILGLDIISFVYSLYQSYITPNPNGCNDLQVSFNLLKNQVNTILDRKNDLTITQISSPMPNSNYNSNSNSNNNSNNNSKFQHVRINNNTQEQHASNHSYNDFPAVINNNNNNNNNNQTNGGQYSTPISQLKSLKNNNNNSSSFSSQSSSSSSSSTSTPINLIREKINVSEPTINEMPHQNVSSYAESVVGSDLGSVMDLDEFEKSL